MAHGVCAAYPLLLLPVSGRDKLLMCASIPFFHAFLVIVIVGAYILSPIEVHETSMPTQVGVGGP